MKKLIYLALFTPLFSFSQFGGDSLFNTSQVIRVDLTFNQVGFWDSLVANYPTETNMIAAGLQITDIYGVHNMDSIEIRLKGNSSYGHPGNKKSFKIDINKVVQGQNYEGLKKLNFNNGFKDPTFMREKLFSDVCKTMGVPAPRVNYANVYMNGTFWGFYTVVEQIDDQFLEWAILEDQGNLFKAGDNSDGQTPADLMNYGTTASAYTSRYELKTNTVTNDWTDLITLITDINASSAANFETTFNLNFDKTKYLRTLALDNLFSSLDSYLNSARNYYLYHNTVTTKWEWIKWDGNEAFGLYTGGPGLGSLETLAPNYIAANRPLVSKFFANSNLYEAYKTEMCAIMDTYFNPTYMNNLATTIKILIQTDVTNDVNKMYTTQNFIDNVEGNITVSGGPMGSQTVFGLKSFVANRYAYLQTAVCSNLGIEEESTTEIQIYPNPFNESFVINSDFISLELIDATGRKIDFSTTAKNGKTEILVNAKAGNYFLNVVKNQGNYKVTLVKN